MFAVPSNRHLEHIACQARLGAVVTHEGPLSELAERRFSLAKSSFPTLSSWHVRGPLEVKVHLRDDITRNIPKPFVELLLSRCSWNPPPTALPDDEIAGIRAFTFPLPFELNSDNRFLAGVKIKGNCYYRATSPGFRAMRMPDPGELWTSGQPSIQYVLPPQGGLEYEPARYTPCGAMFLQRAEREFIMTTLCFADGLPTSLPIGFGEMPALRDRSGAPLGFVILAVPPRKFRQAS